MNQSIKHVAKWSEGLGGRKEKNHRRPIILTPGATGYTLTKLGKYYNAYTITDVKSNRIIGMVGRTATKKDYDVLTNDGFVITHFRNLLDAATMVIASWVYDHKQAGITV